MCVRTTATESSWPSCSSQQHRGAPDRFTTHRQHTLACILFDFPLRCNLKVGRLCKVTIAWIGIEQDLAEAHRGGWVLEVFVLVHYGYIGAAFRKRSLSKGGTARSSHGLKPSVSSTVIPDQSRCCLVVSLSPVSRPSERQRPAARCHSAQYGYRRVEEKKSA